MTACQNPHSRAVGTTIIRQSSADTGSSHWNQCASVTMSTTAKIPNAHSSENRST